MSIRSSIIIRIGGWLSFICTLFLGVIAYATFDTVPPFKTTDSIITVARQNGANVMVESRGFAGSDTQELTVYRTFYHQGSAISHRVAIEGGTVINQNAEYVVLRSFVIPPHISGAWCSSAIVYWRPALSLKQHSAKLQDICFEVPIND
jgi:hypothetical protein